MAYKRNGVHKFQVTLHQPQKAKRNTGEREGEEKEEAGKGLQRATALPAIHRLLCVLGVWHNKL